MTEQEAASALLAACVACYAAPMIAGLFLAWVRRGAIQ